MLILISWLLSVPCRSIKSVYRDQCCGNPEASVNNTAFCPSIEAPETTLDSLKRDRDSPLIHPTFLEEMVYKNYYMALHRSPTAHERQLALSHPIPQQVMNDLYTGHEAAERFQYESLYGQVYACVACSSGIGFQVAVTVAQAGAKVYACARSRNVFDGHKQSAMKLVYETVMPWNGYNGIVGVDASVFDNITFKECDVRLGSRDYVASAPGYYNLNPEKSMEAFFETIYHTEGRLDGLLDMNMGTFNEFSSDDPPYTTHPPLSPLEEAAMSPDRYNNWKINQTTASLQPVILNDVKDAATVANMVYYGTRNILQWARFYMDETTDSAKIIAYISSAWQFFKGNYYGTPKTYATYKAWIATSVMPQLKFQGYKAMSISPPSVATSNTALIFDAAVFKSDLLPCPIPSTRTNLYSKYDVSTNRPQLQGAYRLAGAYKTLLGIDWGFAGNCTERDEVGNFELNEVEFQLLLQSAGDNLGTWSHTPLEFAMQMRHMISHPSTYSGKDVVYFFPPYSMYPFYDWNGQTSIFPEHVLHYDRYFDNHATAKEAYGRLLHAISGGGKYESNISVFERIIV